MLKINLLHTKFIMRDKVNFQIFVYNCENNNIMFLYSLKTIIIIKRDDDNMTAY